MVSKHSYRELIKSQWLDYLFIIVFFVLFVDVALSFPNISTKGRVFLFGYPLVLVLQIRGVLVGKEKLKVSRSNEEKLKRIAFVIFITLLLVFIYIYF